MIKAKICENLDELNKVLAEAGKSKVDVKFTSQITGQVKDDSGVSRFAVVDRFLVLIEEK